MELVFLAVLILLMVAALSCGFPVAFALPGCAIGAISLAALCGFLFAGDPAAYFAQDGPTQWLNAGVTNFRSLYWQVERDTLIAIPLFIFMGIMLQRSKIAEDLLVAMAQLFGPVPGGLGISVIFVGALLAATTGILGATVIAMGLISLPAMLKNNYSKPLASGIICASGTLGQIIPPSIVLIILADQLANAADQARTMRTAQYKEASGEFSLPGEFDITSASAGDMFMGALVPGLLLVGLYMLYILIRALLKPDSAPAIPYDGNYDRKFIFNISLALIPPLALIFVVLGSIIGGIATVNQAGAIGAVGATVMGGYRLNRTAKHRYTPLIIVCLALFSLFILLQFFNLNIKNITHQRDFYAIIAAAIAAVFCIGGIACSAWRTYKHDNTLASVMTDTAKTTSMVFIILIGAAMLTAAFRGFGGEHLVREFLSGLPGGFWTQFIVVMLVIFLLGFFLDFIEIAVVVVPIVAPILLADPAANITAVWLGVMIGLNMQTSFLTPPFGFALFYLRGVAPPQVKTTHIYKGAAAFIILQLVALGIVGSFPALVNYLPNKIYLSGENAPPPINPKLQQCIENHVLPLYPLQRQAILHSINSLKAQDFSVIPATYRQPLDLSFTLAQDTFAHVDKLNATRLALKNYRADPTPTLTSTQTLTPTQTLAKQRYQQLAQADQAASTAYRRNADNSYQPLHNLLQVLRANGELTKSRLAHQQLSGVYAQSDRVNAIKRIKKVEQLLGEIAGAGDIKAALAKSRRALKQAAQADSDPLKIAEAQQHYRQSRALLEGEIAWRQAAQPLLSPLDRYHTLIKDTIGIRLQAKFSRAQAQDIAACLSVHKNIALNF